MNHIEMMFEIEENEASEEKTIIAPAFVISPIQDYMDRRNAPRFEIDCGQNWNTRCHCCEVAYMDANYKWQKLTAWALNKEAAYKKAVEMYQEAIAA